MKKNIIFEQENYIIDKDRKHEIWLFGNGLNIQFATEKNKDWLKFLEYFGEKLLKNENINSYKNEPFDENNSFNKFIDFLNYEVTTLNLDSHQSFLISKILILICTKINNKIYQRYIKESRYYEAIMESTINDSFIEWTEIETEEWQKKSNKGFNKELGKPKTNFYMFKTFFKINKEELILKYEFKNEMEQMEFYTLNKNFINSSKLVKARNDLYILILDLPIFEIFKLFYLEGIRFWIESIKKEFENGMTLYNFRNFFIERLGKNILSKQPRYTTNYYDVTKTICDWGSEGMARPVYLYLDNEEIYPSKKIKFLQKYFDAGWSVYTVKKYFRELNIFGLNPNSDLDLIKKIIDTHKIKYLRYWYYSDDDKNKVQKYFTEKCNDKTGDEKDIIKYKFSNVDLIWYSRMLEIVKENYKSDNKNFDEDVWTKIIPDIIKEIKKIINKYEKNAEFKNRVKEVFNYHAGYWENNKFLDFQSSLKSSEIKNKISILLKK